MFMQVHSMSFFTGNRFFQAEHPLYTPGLNENRGSSDFVHNIWIFYKQIKGKRTVKFHNLDSERCVQSMLTSVKPKK